MNSITRKMIQIHEKVIQQWWRKDLNNYELLEYQTDHMSRSFRITYYNGKSKKHRCKYFEYKILPNNFEFDNTKEFHYYIKKYLKSLRNTLRKWKINKLLIDQHLNEILLEIL